MKVLKSVLIAGSLFAAVAHAQTPAPAADAQQVAQASAQQPEVRQPSSVTTRSRIATQSKKASECVGPAGFCNIYFGS
ncbi:MAG: hypothetical protein WCA85_30680 [Paraburkholderia sp.]|uniref:hypothetical protein n=1 Tax=Paraburkholderia sp. TaxID=1926495 RepID=UPI003C54400D